MTLRINQWELASLNGSRNRNNAVEQCQVTIDRCESFIEGNTPPPIDGLVDPRRGDEM